MAQSANSQQLSHLHFRRRQQQLESDEDAAELKLGPEFQNQHCLLYAEVKILLEKLKQQRLEVLQQQQGGGIGGAGEATAMLNNGTGADEVTTGYADSWATPPDPIIAMEKSY